MLRFTLLFVFLGNLCVFSQVGIGTTNPNSSAKLHIESSDKGILIPRVDIADLSTAAPVTSPAESLLVYNENATTGKGFYYWNGSKWIGVANPIKINDLLDGKSDVDGTDDGSSVYLGINAGAADDASNNKNVGVGYGALEANTGALDGGKNNTAIGYIALSKNVAGRNNTAVGLNSLKENTSGVSNVAVGAFAQARSLTGNNNVSVGNQSMKFNESGENNTAVGDYALRGDADEASPIPGTSNFNVAIGKSTLYNLSSGEGNVGVGFQAGGDLANGDKNIFIGYQAGKNETGSNKLYIDNSNTTTPLIYGDFSTDKLEINGDLQSNTLQVSSTGSVITSIIKKTVSADIPNIPSGDKVDVDFPVPGATGGSSVHISPESLLPKGVIISCAKAGVDIVKVRFFNAHNDSDKDPNAMDFYITVIK